MAEAGGSAATWQVLLLVRSGDWSTQSQLAKAMGVTGATLTHHLQGLEADGLVRRWREPANGRVQRVELTPEGAEMFERLRTVAQRHDERLRAALSEAEIGQLREILDRLDTGLHAPGDLGV
jgi:MarR family transcriptional regulator for hemolysin